MPAAIVMVKPWESTGKIHRRPIGARASIDFVTDLRINFPGPLDVIAHKQIELAVIIVIKKSRGGAPVVGRTGDACFERELAEFALAFIVEQMTAANYRHNNVVHA